MNKGTQRTLDSKPRTQRRGAVVPSKLMVPHPGARKTTSYNLSIHNVPRRKYQRAKQHVLGGRLNASVHAAHIKWQQMAQPSFHKPSGKRTRDRCDVPAHWYCLLRFWPPRTWLARVLCKTCSQRTQSSGLTTKHSIPVAKRRVGY